MISFHHVAISSADADKSVSFYKQLGFRTVFNWSAPNGELRIVHMRLGEAILEIFNYSDPEEAPASTKSLETDLRRLGVKHFGLRVADIDAARKKFEKSGLGKHLEVKEGRTGIKYFFVNDPDGNWVEIVQDDRGV